VTTRKLTDATLVVRDAIYEGLLIRKGEVLTEELCRERANNVCHYVVEALAKLAEESKPPPFGRVARHLEDLTNDTEGT
jgi:hypothetical protein